MSYMIFCIVHKRCKKSGKNRKTVVEYSEILVIYSEIYILGQLKKNLMCFIRQRNHFLPFCGMRQDLVYSVRIKCSCATFNGGFVTIVSIFFMIIITAKVVKNEK